MHTMLCKISILVLLSALFGIVARFVTVMTPCCYNIYSVDVGHLIPCAF